MFCQRCGREINVNTAYCPYCGTQINNVTITHNYVPANGQPEPKNKWIAFLLCLFLGGIGAHKFYEGKILFGIIYLLTCGLFGIGWLVDTILILLKPNPYYA